MAINVGSNFSYNGKFFLDARQSFDTLAAMRAFPSNSVPEGFIAYCKEDKKRYEFKNEEWVEFVAGSGATEEDIARINTELLKQVDEKLNDYATLEYVDNAISDVIINEGTNGNCNYFGEEEPENDEQVWFSNSIASVSSGLEFDNPLIEELFACIRTLQAQVAQLQADVEYLKVNGGGGIPDWPDIDEPDVIEDGFFLLEDGGFFILEDDSGQLVLEDYSIIETVKEDVLALEDGSMFLLEDGGYILLEEQVVTPPVQQGNFVLLENGEQMLLENGYNILLEN